MTTPDPYAEFMAELNNLTTTVETPTVAAMLTTLLADGWTTKALARETRTSMPTITHWANGRRTPTNIPGATKTITRLWQETQQTNQPEPATTKPKPDWYDATCYNHPDKDAWADPPDRATALIAARLCRTSCPLLDACKRLKADYRKKQLPIHGVLAGELPAGPRSTDTRN